MNQSPHEINTKETVITPIRWKASLYVIMFMLFIGLVGLMMNGASTASPHHTKYLIVSWLLIVGFVVCCINYLVSVFAGIPNIILNADGLSYRTIYRKHFWAWSELGPFAIDIQQINLNRTFYACALTRDHHQRMRDESPLYQASLSSADIKIPLSLLAPGQDGQKALAFAALLNEWRDAHRPTEG